MTILSRILTKQGFGASSSNISIIIVYFNYVSMVVYGPLGLKVKWHLKSRTLLSEICVSTFLEMEKEVICICPALGGVIQVPSSVSVLLHACGIENFFIKQFNILIFFISSFYISFWWPTVQFRSTKFTFSFFTDSRFGSESADLILK